MRTSPSTSASLSTKVGLTYMSIRIVIMMINDILFDILYIYSYYLKPGLEPEPDSTGHYPSCIEM